MSTSTLKTLLRSSALALATLLVPASMMAAGTNRQVASKANDARPAMRGIGAQAATITSNHAPIHKVLGGTLVDEDFSLFTAGSEDAIDDEMICDYYDMSIPDSYFHQPGWWGLGVMQAGGAAALAYPDFGGFLSTPLGNYGGQITLSFRMKAIDSNPIDSVVVYVSVGHNQTSPVSIEGKTLKAGKGDWQEHTLTFNSSYGGNDAYVQFNTYDYILVDDVKVVQSVTSLANPVLKDATNFTRDGFTANWDPVAYATDYLLSVFRWVPTGEGNQSYEQHFNDGVPEDWTYIKGPDNTGGMYSNAESGVDNAVLLENGDTIAIPSNGGTVTSFSIDLILVGGDPEGSHYGNLQLEGFDGVGWHYLNTISASQFSDTVPRISFDLPDRLLNRFKAYRLRAWYSEAYLFAVDDVKWTTTDPAVMEFALDEKPVADTHYVVTGLEPESDYYYTVRSRNIEEDLIGDLPSTSIDAWGVAAPDMLPATEVDGRGSYTANWEPAPKATSYSVQNYDVYTAPSAVEGHVILHEDFSKLDDLSNTPEDPYYFTSSGLMALDDYTQRPGWYGYLAGAVNGAIAGLGYPEYGMSAQIQTPYLTLGNNGGKVHVKVVARTTADNVGDYLRIYSFNNLTGFSGELTTEWQTIEGDIENCTMDDIVVFDTQYAGLFFISEVTVTQDLAEGDKIYEQLSEDEITDTSYTFSDLEVQENHTYAYDVFSIYKRGDNSVWSDRSQRVEVDLNSPTGITEVETQPAAKQVVERYSIDGRRLQQAEPGVNIVRYSDGSFGKVLTK